MSDRMNDPRLDIADAVRPLLPDLPDSRTIAEATLTALLAAGWRLVRTDGCANPSAPFGQCGCADLTISEEYRQPPS